MRLDALGRRKGLLIVWNPLTDMSESRSCDTERNYPFDSGVCGLFIMVGRERAKADLVSCLVVFVISHHQLCTATHSLPQPNIICISQASACLPVLFTMSAWQDVQQRHQGSTPLVISGQMANSTWAPPCWAARETSQPYPEVC